MQTQVFAIGLDPDYADYSKLKDISPELVRAYIQSQLEHVRSAGYQLTECLLRPGRADIDNLTRALQSQNFDCIVIGAGLRAEEHILLFEQALNLVHYLQPKARICFNTNPADTLEAIQRWT
jgi:hypothetical protein